MVIPGEFSKEIREKLTAVDVAAQKNIATAQALEAQFSADDLRNAANATGVQTAKYATKNTVGGLPATKVGTESFYSKNKWLIISSVLIAVGIIVVFLIKRKR